MDPALDPDDVAYAGVVGQRALLRDRRLTAVELLDLCLARIARLDGRLGAFRVLFEASARKEALAADTALAAGDERPLLGVPVAVKDNVAVAGHAPSQGTGSPEPVAERDAEVVRRLRAAGAVVVGATRLPELALWPFTESPTWGVTRNPWDLGRTPGGSSGGSAAAVAAGLVAAAHATDGGGSIRVPAACCGLVGLKPGRGRVDLAPDTEHWEGLSSANAVTRSVADAAELYAVLSDEDVTLTDPGPLTIAWSVKAPVPTPVDPLVRAALDGVVGTLRGLGHTVVAGDPDYRRVQASFLVRYGRGAAADLARLVDPSATEPRTRAVAAVGRTLSDRLLARAHRWGDDATSRLSVLPGGADLLLTPTLAAPPQRIGAQTGLRTLATAGRVVPFTVAWNVSGLPAVSLPAGATPEGVPLAVQLVAPPGGEALLLRVAAQLEAATAWTARRPPLDG
jgi:amidase